LEGWTGFAETVSVTVVVADWAAEAESDTDTPKEKLPVVVGVPEIIPVPAARLSPAGSCPETRLQV
jgi:hypothetical protein